MVNCLFKPNNMYFTSGCLNPLMKHLVATNNFCNYGVGPLNVVFSERSLSSAVRLVNVNAAGKARNGRSINDSWIHQGN